MRNADPWSAPSRWVRVLTRGGACVSPRRSGHQQGHRPGQTLRLRPPQACTQGALGAGRSLGRTSEPRPVGGAKGVQTRSTGSCSGPWGPFPPDTSPLAPPPGFRFPPPALGRGGRLRRLPSSPHTPEVAFGACPPGSTSPCGHPAGATGLLPSLPGSAPSLPVCFRPSSSVLDPVIAQKNLSRKISPSFTWGALAGQRAGFCLSPSRSVSQGAGSPFPRGAPRASLTCGGSRAGEQRWPTCLGPGKPGRSPRHPLGWWLHGRHPVPERCLFFLYNGGEGSASQDAEMKYLKPSEEPGKTGRGRGGQGQVPRTQPTRAGE